MITGGTRYEPEARRLTGGGGQVEDRGPEADQTEAHPVDEGHRGQPDDRLVWAVIAERLDVQPVQERRHVTQGRRVRVANQAAGERKLQVPRQGRRFGRHEPLSGGSPLPWR